MRINAFLLGIVSNIVTLMYGRFENEFIRVCLVAMVQLFSFYADQHFVLRLGSLILNFMAMIFLEYYYLRESLMQAACYDRQLCKGGSSFNQLIPLQNWKINDGIILVHGEISYGWMLANFWRAFIALTLHYVQILAIMQ